MTNYRVTNDAQPPSDSSWARPASGDAEHDSGSPSSTDVVAVMTSEFARSAAVSTVVGTTSSTGSSRHQTDTTATGGSITVITDAPDRKFHLLSLYGFDL